MPRWLQWWRLIPDRFPPAQRGTVVGILGVCMPVGQITGTFLVQQLAINMTLALVIRASSASWACWGCAFVLRREPLRSCCWRNRLQLSCPVIEPRPNGPRDHRDFSWTWLSRVFFTTGSCFLQAYQPFFLLDALHFSAADVPRLIFRSTLVQAAMVVIWSLISGRLSDRTGLRKPFCHGGLDDPGAGTVAHCLLPTPTACCCSELDW